MDFSLKPKNCPRCNKKMKKNRCIACGSGFSQNNLKDPQRKKKMNWGTGIDGIYAWAKQRGWQQ